MSQFGDGSCFNEDLGHTRPRAAFKARCGLTIWLTLGKEFNEQKSMAGCRYTAWHCRGVSLRGSLNLWVRGCVCVRMKTIPSGTIRVKEEEMEARWIEVIWGRDILACLFIQIDYSMLDMKLTQGLYRRTYRRVFIENWRPSCLFELSC